MLERHTGTGACFRVLLPVTQPLSEVVPEKSDRFPLGGESILLVDDEPSLADLGKQMSGRLGYQVTCCQRSLDALALVEERPGAFDLVVTDLTMPHMAGDVLAGRLLAVRPDLPIILCTGHSDYPAKDGAEQRGVSACLTKPLAIADLARTLRVVLDRGRGRSTKLHQNAASSR